MSMSYLDDDPRLAPDGLRAAQQGAAVSAAAVTSALQELYGFFVEHYDEMEHRYEPTDKGMKATVTGKTALGIKIARNHAKAVSDFAAHGWLAHDRAHPAVAGGTDNAPGGPRRKK